MKKITEGTTAVNHAVAKSLGVRQWSPKVAEERECLLLSLADALERGGNCLVIPGIGSEKLPRAAAAVQRRVEELTELLGYPQTVVVLDTLMKLLRVTDAQNISVLVDVVARHGNQAGKGGTR